MKQYVVYVNIKKCVSFLFKVWWLPYLKVLNLVWKESEKRWVSILDNQTTFSTFNKTFFLTKCDKSLTWCSVTFCQYFSKYLIQIGFWKFPYQDTIDGLLEINIKKREAVCRVDSSPVIQLTSYKPMNS